MANLFFEELEKKSDGTYEKEIRAKAIDEFAKKLFDEAYEDYESDKLIIDYADVVLIAEQLKGGAV